MRTRNHPPTTHHNGPNRNLARIKSRPRLLQRPLHINLVFLHLSSFIIF